MRVALIILVATSLACSQPAAPDRTKQDDLPAGDKTHTSSQAPSSSPSTETSASTTSSPMRVDGKDVKAPVAIKRVDVNFEPCIQANVQIGLSIVEAVIDEAGVPRNIRLLKEQPPCVEKQVIAALEEWRFRPGTYRGEPVPVIFNMTVMPHFR